MSKIAAGLFIFVILGSWSLTLAKICPDGHSRCKATQTCCSDVDGGYACCNYVNAVCCNDKMHCCPADYDCNASETACLPKNKTSGSNRSKSLGKLHLVELETKFNDNSVSVEENTVEKFTKTQCPPPSKDTCPDKYTCCKERGGGYGCCPYDKAVCCDDHLHCCPHGNICNTSKGRCDSTIFGF